MTINLQSIQKRLKKSIKGFDTDFESIYKVGVEIGRKLEKSNAPDFRLPYFITLEEERNINDAARKLHREIGDIVLKQVHSAIREIISTNNSWTVGVGQYYRGDGKFSDEIIEKYGVAFDSIDQQYSGGHFETVFTVKGRLEKCFSDYGYFPRLEVTLDNGSGDDYVHMSCDEDIENLYSPGLMMPIPKSIEELEKLRQVKTSLDKTLLFQVIGRT